MCRYATLRNKKWGCLLFIAPGIDERSALVVYEVTLRVELQYVRERIKKLTGKDSNDARLNTEAEGRRVDQDRE